MITLSGIGDKLSEAVSPTYSVVYAGKAMLSFDMIEEAGFKASSDLTGYPVENGVTVTDYKYDNPDTVTLRGVVSRSNALFLGNTVGQIKTNLKFLKSGVYKCTVKTRNDTYYNMCLVDYEIAEDADNFGALVVDMTFEEIVTLDAAEKRTANPADTDTVNVGLAFVKRII